jgi:hypothetical protein
MPLAARALIPVPAVPGMAGITCHFATWFWAAQEAQQSGQTPVKTAAVTIGNIAAMVPDAQAAMLALPTTGTWDFSLVPTTPPAGSGDRHRAAPDQRLQPVGLVSGAGRPGADPAVQAHLAAATLVGRPLEAGRCRRRSDDRRSGGRAEPLNGAPGPPDTAVTRTTSCGCAWGLADGVAALRH